MRRLYVVFAGVCMCMMLGMMGCKKQAEAPEVSAAPETPDAQALEKSAYDADRARVSRIVDFHDEMVKIVKENASDCDALATKWSALVSSRHDELIKDTQESELMIVPENELEPEVEAQMVRLRKRAEYVTSDEVIGLCDDHEGVKNARGKLFDAILEMDNIVIERRKQVAFELVLQFFESFGRIAVANKSDCDQMASALDAYIDKNIETLKLNVAKSPSFSESPYDQIFENVLNSVMGSNSVFYECVQRSEKAVQTNQKFLSSFQDSQALSGKKQAENEKLKEISLIIDLFEGMEKYLLEPGTCQALGVKLQAYLKTYDDDLLRSAFSTLAQMEVVPPEVGARLERAMFMANEKSEAFKRLQLCATSDASVAGAVGHLLELLGDEE